jgi:putative oxidoreductase
MRLTWGPQFFVMGAQKLANLSESTESFTSLGFSHPLFHSYVAGYIELIGGIALIIGLGSRLFTIPLIITTLTILSKAHGSPISEWKLLTHPSLISHQPPYPFLIVALLILIFGPGKLSIDGWIKRRLQQKHHQ